MLEYYDFQFIVVWLILLWLNYCSLFHFNWLFTIALYDSWVGDELREVRNTHAAFHATPFGLLFGLVHAALTCFITRGKEPWTFRNNVPDSDKTDAAANHKEIVYPKSDGVLSFDLLTNLQRSGIQKSILVIIIIIL